MKQKHGMVMVSKVAEGFLERVSERCIIPRLKRNYAGWCLSELLDVAYG